MWPQRSDRAEPDMHLGPGMTRDGIGAVVDLGLPIRVSPIGSFRARRDAQSEGPCQRPGTVAQSDLDSDFDGINSRMMTRGGVAA